MNEDTPEREVILQMPPWFKHLISRKEELELMMDELQKQMLLLQREHGFLNGWVAHNLVNTRPSIQDLEGDGIGWIPVSKTKIKAFLVDLPDNSPIDDALFRKYFKDVTVLQHMGIPWELIKKYVKLREVDPDPEDLGFFEDDEDEIN